MQRKTIKSLLCLTFLGVLFINGCQAKTIDADYVETIVSDSVRPIMAEYNIAGMAVALTIDGKQHFYNYGVASRKTQQPVSNTTIFEVGSISKTFTATLATYAQENGKLSLNDSISKHIPYLSGSSLGNISVLHLATHTAGGFPMQLPDYIDNEAELMDYYKNWQPRYQAGRYRSYANPSIGLLGMIAAKAMNAPFTNLMEDNLFAKLGLHNTYINVPATKESQYAQGYDKSDKPVRLNQDILGDEAYGVRSSSIDLIRFVEANMQLVKLDKNLQRAIDNTHVGYFKVGAMTQELVWEHYSYPPKIEDLLAGNSSLLSTNDVPVIELDPPLAPQRDVWINKTGSTNGFGGYVVFIPAKKMGIVILANKQYPNPDRAAIAYQILTKLEQLLKK